MVKTLLLCDRMKIMKFFSKESVAVFQTLPGSFLKD